MFFHFCFLLRTRNNATNAYKVMMHNMDENNGRGRTKNRYITGIALQFVVVAVRCGVNFFYNNFFRKIMCFENNSCYFQYCGSY